MFEITCTESESVVTWRFTDPVGVEYITELDRSKALGGEEYAVTETVEDSGSLTSHLLPLDVVLTRAAVYADLAKAFELPRTDPGF
jgi:hypothetical protein